MKAFQIKYKNLLTMYQLINSEELTNTHLNYLCEKFQRYVNSKDFTIENIKKYIIHVYEKNEFHNPDSIINDFNSIFGKNSFQKIKETEEFKSGIHPNLKEYIDENFICLNNTRKYKRFL